MGFVVFAEVVRARRKVLDDSAAAAVQRGVSADELEGLLEDCDTVWGLLPSQPILATNYLQENDIEELIDVPEAQEPVDCDWRDAVPGTLLEIYHTAHGWLYSPCATSFDRNSLEYQWVLLRLPDRESTIAHPRFRNTELRLMLPPPSDYALEQAEDIDQDGEEQTLHETADFIARFPCWPVKLALRCSDRWRDLPPATRDHYELLQPDTASFRTLLEGMNRLLLHKGIFCCELSTASGHAIGSMWDSAEEQISLEVREALGAKLGQKIPLAWYASYDEADIEDAFHEKIDPEGLVEEWQDRVYWNRGAEAAPGVTRTYIYFDGMSAMKHELVGAQIMAAAEAAGLRASWNGSDKEVIQVALI